MCCNNSISVLTAVTLSSESYEVAFPILSFHANVQILGQKCGSIRKERENGSEGENHGQIPRVLGWQSCFGEEV